VLLLLLLLLLRLLAYSFSWPAAEHYLPQHSRLDHRGYRAFPPRGNGDLIRGLLLLNLEIPHCALNLARRHVARVSNFLLL
jgi:hypothetical protein